MLTELESLAARQLVELALVEDLGGRGDVTSTALIPEGQSGAVQIVARVPGVLAGLPIVEHVFCTLDPRVQVMCRASDGARLTKGMVVAELTGPLHSLLVGERTSLNFLTHLSGIATLTAQYVAAVSGTQAGIYDTRKTLPGWRVLQKYAVRTGGGGNHRMGLYDMVLIKDNHLAGWAAAEPGHSIADAIHTARKQVPRNILVEVEVDNLDQLVDALTGQPDMILLDNMSCEMLRQAVALRDARAPHVVLEASGGVSLATVAEIAATGVNRISVGALTHSAPALDLAFDWKIEKNED